MDVVWLRLINYFNNLLKYIYLYHIEKYMCVYISIDIITMSRRLHFI